MSRRGLAAFGLLALGMACGSFRDGDSEPSVDAGPDDAAAAVETGAIGDDASAADSSPPDAAAACGHTFCADFESVPFDALFEHVATQPAILLATTELSPGRALRATVPVRAYGVGSNHYLRKKLTQTPKTATFHHRVRAIKQPYANSGNTVQVATIGWGDEDANRDRVSEIQIRVGAGIILGKRDEESSDFHGQELPLKTGWMDVRVVVTFGPTRDDHARVLVDNVMTLDVPFVSDSDPTQIDIGVGCAGVDSAQPTEVIFDVDDVWLDIEP